MKYLHTINTILEKIETILVIIILTSMIIIAFTQILLRNFFSTSLSWGDVLLRHLVLWIGFLSASLATREGKHISIDVFSKILKPKAKNITQIFVNLFAALISFFLMNAAIDFIKMEYEGGGTLFYEFPVWIAQLIIAIGFGTMMFRFFIKALENVAGLITSKQENQE